MSSSGSYVEELILRKELIMDLLSLYLDRSIYPKFRGAPSLAQHWEHLADYCEVDAKIKKQCRNSAHLSPSEAMFKHLCQSWESINVGTLKQNLLEIKRKDVYDELANNQDLLGTNNITSCTLNTQWPCTVLFELTKHSSTVYFAWEQDCSDRQKLLHLFLVLCLMPKWEIFVMIFTIIFQMMSVWMTFVINTQKHCGTFVYTLTTIVLSSIGIT